MSRGEKSMVPETDFRSYYGQPILKEPEWKVPDVPLYFFLGGLAGASASLAAYAEFTGRPGIVRAGRLVAAGGSIASVATLMHDLGRPMRFLNMLRVLKPTSPLSVGSWIIAPFSALTSAAATSQLTGVLPGLGRAAGLISGGLGPAMCTYTAVLISDTAVPSWHDAYREMPFLFAGSAMTSGAAAALVGAPLAEHAPARRLALLGAAVEFAGARRVERGLGLSSEPYRTGRAAALLKAGQALTAVGAGLSLLGRRSRIASIAAGASLLAAGLSTRFGIFEAGRTSARDPKYTVIPQRERLAKRELAAREAAAGGAGRPEAPARPAERRGEPQPASPRP